MGVGLGVRVRVGLCARACLRKPLGLALEAFPDGRGHECASCWRLHCQTKSLNGICILLHVRLLDGEGLCKTTSCDCLASLDIRCLIGASAATAGGLGLAVMAG